MKKRIDIKAIVLFLVALAIGLSLGFLHAKLYGVTLDEERINTVEVYDEAGLAALGTSIYNDRITLDENITLNELSGLCTAENPFVGSFDGMGYTIFYNGSLDKSIFGYIGEGGVIKNLSIVVNDTDIEANMSAVLALENRGTIENCKIYIKCANIKAEGSHSAVATVNRGNIKNVYTEVTYKKATEENGGSARRLYIGALAARNYGRIENSISEITFIDFPETNKADHFAGNLQNTSVGAVTGINEGELIGTNAIFSENTITCDNDALVTIYHSSDRSELLMNYTSLGFSDVWWEYKAGKLNLIVGD